MDHIVDFLTKKGIQVESNPNTKLPGEAYALLLKEFQHDKSLKEEAQQLAQSKVKREGAVVLDAQDQKKPASRKEDESREILIKNVAGATGAPTETPKKKKAEPEAKPEAEVKPAAKAKRPRKKLLPKKRSSKPRPRRSTARRFWARSISKLKPRHRRRPPAVRRKPTNRKQPHRLKFRLLPYPDTDTGCRNSCGSGSTGKSGSCCGCRNTGHARGTCSTRCDNARYSRDAGQGRRLRSSPCTVRQPDRSDRAG